MLNDQRVITKHRLQDGGATTIKGWFTKALHVGEQKGELMIWMENSILKTDDYSGNQIPRDESEKVQATVYAIGTGWPYSLSGVGEYVGTVQMSDGLVWHIFISCAKWILE